MRRLDAAAAGKRGGEEVPGGIRVGAEEEGKKRFAVDFIGLPLIQPQASTLIAKRRRLGRQIMAQEPVVALPADRDRQLGAASVVRDGCAPCQSLAGLLACAGKLFGKPVRNRGVNLVARAFFADSVERRFRRVETVNGEQIGFSRRLAEMPIDAQRVSGDRRHVEDSELQFAFLVASQNQRQLVLPDVLGVQEILADEQ